jgi:methylenetetrahydrofolate reductase (NADPH)
MTAQAAKRFQEPALSSGDERSTIVRLAQRASVEMTVHDVAKLAECQSILKGGSSFYISHLPGQEWQATIATAAQVRGHGFEPVPHVPVRKLVSRDELEQVLEQLSSRAGVKQILLIAGDVKAAAGPFKESSQVMKSGLLGRYGITRLSVAGHPEGHPAVSESETRSAEVAKSALAAELGIELTFVTQFLFESAPIVSWSRQLHERDVRGQVAIGLAGPAKLTTLINYAMRCGVGPSMRALSQRGGALTKLLGERGPEKIVREIAGAMLSGTLAIDSLHFYTFGGLLRTCRWVKAVSEGRFELDDDAGFVLASD